MSLSENGNGMVMPVGPMYGNGGFGNGFGGDGWWVILFLFALMGNNGWGGFGGGNGSQLYPWMNQSDQINGGFRDQSILNGITDIQTGLCNGLAGVEANANARQLANQQSFFDLQSQFANCCCENRIGIANLGSEIAREACADRAAVSDGIRDILVNQNANTQRILDQMCNDKIDAKNEKIADLERQLTMANLTASQGAQTSQILADNARQTVALEQYLNPTPVPAYVVANPNCCQNACGFNCGCGA
jgi:hypothetical protein